MTTICRMRIKEYVFNRFAILNQRALLCTRSNRSRPYQDNENAYYRQALVNSSPQYDPSSFIAKLNLSNCSTSNADVKFVINKNFFELSPDVIFKKFVLLARSVNSDSTVTLEDPNVEPICKSLVLTIPKLTDDQLYQVLLCLTKWSFISTTRSKSYKSIWNTLDREFCARCNNLKTTDLLKVAHGWDELALNRITNYNYTMIDVLCQRLESLKLMELVNLLYFINLQRKISGITMLAIEKELLTRNIEQLELDELGVIALGFFKTQSSIKSVRFIKRILSKVEKDFHNVNNFNLSSIVKVIRCSLSSRFIIVDELSKFQKLSLGHISTLSSPTILHLALMSMKFTACDEDLLKFMISSFIRDIRSIRLKDLSVSLFCVSQILAHDQLSKEYAEKVVTEFTLPDRAEEILKYPHHFISLVLCAAHLDVFHEDILNKCLNKDFLAFSDENASWEWEREAFSIDMSIELECLEYKGSRLSKARASAIYKRNFSSHHAEVTTNHSQLLKDIHRNISVYLGGNDFCRICEILPHYHHKDLIVVKDKEGKWKMLPEQMKPEHSNRLLFPQKNEQWFAIFVGGKAYYNLTNNQLIGSYKMKCRQLRQLGFTVIQLHHHEYSRLSESEKIAYLSNKFMNLN